MHKHPTAQMLQKALTHAIGDIDPMPEMFSTVHAILHLTRYIPTDPEMLDIIQLLKRDYDFYSNLMALMAEKTSE
jgi:hypothetical protein